MDRTGDNLELDGSEFETRMGCQEGRDFVNLLVSTLNLKHQGTKDSGKRTAYYAERKALDRLTDALGSISSGSGVSPNALLAALDKVVKKNKAVSKMAYDVVESAVSAGFCSDDDFFSWFRKYRCLLSECHNRNKTTLDALQGYRHIIVVKETAPSRKQTKDRITVITTDSENTVCQSMLIDFLETVRPPISPRGSTEFFMRFSASLGFSPETYSDFSVDTFDAQLRWFSAIDTKVSRQNAITQLKLFYSFVASKLPDTQDAFTFETGLVKEAFLYRYLADAWLEGYRSVIFNPLDPPPSFPKWLLFPNKEEARHSSFVLGKPTMVDTTTHEDFQALLHGWLWSRGDAVKALRSTSPICNKLIRCIVKFGSNKDDVWHVPPRSVLEALAPYQDSSPRNRRGIKGYYRSFLEYGEIAGKLDVDPSCWLQLQTTRSEREDRPSELDALSREETTRLAKALEDRIEKSLADELAYIVFCAQALTPLRQTEILTLRIDNIAPGNHDGFHVIERVTKSDEMDVRRFEIPRKVYELLMVAKADTQDIRDSCNREIGDYLFLLRGAMGVISPLCDNSYRDKLVAAGLSCGIENCTPSRLRKRYMTEVVEHGLKHNLNKLTVNRLTNHSAGDIVNKYYLREDIRNYLEATHGIRIGNPRIFGEITDDANLHEFTEEDAVELNSGYCRNEECNVAGTTTCLMCSGFLTSPQFIPQMEEALATLQIQIAKAPSDHDRQHLVSVKKLFLGYLGKMIEIRESYE